MEINNSGFTGYTLKSFQKYSKTIIGNEISSPETSGDDIEKLFFRMPTKTNLKKYLEEI